MSAPPPICPVCLKTSQPLEVNEAMYGHVAFHRRCEPKLFAAEFVAEMEARFWVPPPPDRYETMRFNGFSWVDDDERYYP